MRTAQTHLQLVAPLGLVYSGTWGSMTKAGRERRRRVKAAALVALGAELDTLTQRMKRLPSVDPETFALADPICIVLRRGIEELKPAPSGLLRPLGAANRVVLDFAPAHENELRIHGRGLNPTFLSCTDPTFVSGALYVPGG